MVDDKDSITTTLALILAQQGFAAIPARTAEEAVGLARENSPVCLVCDIVMGKMNGIQAAIEIQSLCPGCRVILMSGNNTAGELIDSARERGFDFEILAKPFHPRVLLERLRGWNLLPGTIEIA